MSEPPAPPGPPYVDPPAWQPTAAPTNPYGAPAWTPAPRPAPAATNGLSIAALVTGILGVFPVSIALAVIGLRQIRRTGQGGRGLAVAGLVLSGLWFVCFSVIGTLIAVAVAHRLRLGPPAPVAQPAAGREAREQWVVLDHLRVGDCTGPDTSAGAVWRVFVIPCAQPHFGEIYSIAAVPGATLPSTKALDQLCWTQLEQRFPDLSNDPDVDYNWIGPDQASWDSNDRTLICYTLTARPRTGSFEPG